MKSTRIRFTDEQWEFLERFKEQEGISIQFFVSRAIDNEISRIELKAQLESINYSDNVTD